MKKLIFIILFFLLLSSVSAGNNTTEIPNPTQHIEDTPTVIALESGDSNISFSDGYKGYCIEWGEHSAEENETFYINNDVDNNLKVFFVYFYEDAQKDVYATQHMIWKFTDNKEFSRFNQTLYNNIIEKAKTTQVPNEGSLTMNNHTTMFFSFKNFISQYEEYQNYFGYKIFFKNITKQNNTQINESIVDNFTNITKELNNTLIDIYLNKSIIINEENNTNSSISSHQNTKLQEHVCGQKLELIWGWIIIFIVMILLLYKKD